MTAGWGGPGHEGQAASRGTKRAGVRRAGNGDRAVCDSAGSANIDDEFIRLPLPFMYARFRRQIAQKALNGARRTCPQNRSSPQRASSAAGSLRKPMQLRARLRRRSASQRLFAAGWRGQPPWLAQREQRAGAAARCWRGGTWGPWVLCSYRRGTRHGSHAWASVPAAAARAGPFLSHALGMHRGAAAWLSTSRMPQCATSCNHPRLGPGSCRASTQQHSTAPARGMGACSMLAGWHVHGLSCHRSMHARVKHARARASSGPQRHQPAWRPPAAAYG